ncbi:MAG TPA: 30S ribosomal protein S16 [Desulfomonilaceae bacterium]|nr:30S ribosomal protein S16 [Desulfomonilaceae bacterium]
MAVKIRLSRYGAKKKPFYRVIAADSRYPRDGRFLEVLGTYDPRNKSAGINLNLEAIHSWVSRGAEVSDSVRRIMRRSTPAAEIQE